MNISFVTRKTMGWVVLLSSFSTMATRISQEQLLSVLQKANNRLEHLTDNDWILIADKAEQLTFKKGAKLLERDTPTKNVYLILKGTAVIQAGSKTRIGNIGPGEICGEMIFRVRLNRICQRSGELTDQFRLGEK